MGENTNKKHYQKSSDFIDESSTTQLTSTSDGDYEKIRNEIRSDFKQFYPESLFNDFSSTNSGIEYNADKDILEIKTSLNPNWGKFSSYEDHVRNNLKMGKLDTSDYKDEGLHGHFDDVYTLEDLNHREFIVTHAESNLQFGSLNLTHHESMDKEIFITEHTVKKKRKGWEYPIKPIKFEKTLGQKIFLRIKERNKAFFSELEKDELEDFPEPTRSNLHNFLVKLATWETSNSRLKKLYDPWEIFELSLTQGPDFAKHIADLRKYLLFQTNGAWLFSNELYDSFRDYKPQALRLRSTDTQNQVVTSRLSDKDLYRPSWLFYWDPPDEDWEKYIFTPVSIEEKFLTFFRLTIRQYLLEDKFKNFIPINEVSMFDKQSNKKSKEGPQYKNAAVLTLPTLRGTTRITQISREYEKKRVICIEDAKTLAGIRAIEYNTAQLLRAEQKDGMHLKPHTIGEKIRQYMLQIPKWRAKNRFAKWRGESIQYAYCKDFQKEGLTKPRILLRIMLEELQRRFPSSLAYMSPEFFDSWIIDNPKFPMFAHRGHGLGMANALTTLMQIVIERMICEITPIYITGSLYYNDDGVVILQSLQDAYNFALADHFICKHLNLEIKYKSTFIARGFAVLCEQYVHIKNNYINDKSILSRMEIQLIKTAINGSHARYLISTLNVTRKFFTDLDSVAEYWGPVLYPGEEAKTDIVGGWYHLRYNQVNLNFIDKISDNRLSQQEYAAYLTYQETEHQVRPWDKTQVYNKLYAYYDRDFLNFISKEEFLKMRTVRTKMDVKENIRSWQAFQNKIEKTFRAYCSQYRSNTPTWGNIWDELARKHPEIDIIPPIGMYENQDLRTYYNIPSGITELATPYNVFPFEYLKNEWKHKANLEEILHLTSLNITAISSLYNETHTIRQMYGTRFAPLHHYGCVQFPSAAAFSRFINPIGVIDALQKLEGKTVLKPTQIPPYLTEKNRLIYRRAKIYGRELSPDEWIIIGQCNTDTRFALWKLRKFWINQVNPKYFYPDGSIQLRFLIGEIQKYPHIGYYLSFHKRPLKYLMKLLNRKSYSIVEIQDYNTRCTLKPEKVNLTEDTKSIISLMKTDQYKDISYSILDSLLDRPYDPKIIGMEVACYDSRTEDEINPTEVKQSREQVFGIKLITEDNTPLYYYVDQNENFDQINWYLKDLNYLFNMPSSFIMKFLDKNLTKRGHENPLFSDWISSLENDENILQPYEEQLLMLNQDENEQYRNQSKLDSLISELDKVNEKITKNAFYDTDKIASKLKRDFINPLEDEIIDDFTPIDNIIDENGFVIDDEPLNNLEDTLDTQEKIKEKENKKTPLTTSKKYESEKSVIDTDLINPAYFITNADEKEPEIQEDFTVDLLWDENGYPIDPIELELE